MGMIGGATDVDVSAALASATAGDQAAFARIVARYQAELFTIAVLVTRDRSLAQDAAQSAWAIAWRKLHSIRSPERLRPWLVSVTVNEAKQLLRKRRRRADLEAGVRSHRRPWCGWPRREPAGADGEPRLGQGMRDLWRCRSAWWRGLSARSDVCFRPETLR